MGQVSEALCHSPIPISLLMGSDYHLNHPPPPQSSTSICGTVVFHKLVPGANKGWGLLILFNNVAEFQFSSVAQICPTLCNPMNCSTPGFPVHHQLAELAQTHVHRVGDAIQPTHPLSSPSPPALSLSSIRVFSSELVLCIRWPNYWSFSISPSDEYSGLISFRIESLISLQFKELSGVFSNTTVQSIKSLHSALFIVHPYLTSIYTTTRKIIAVTRQTFVDKVMSLLFNMLSRFVIAFLPRSKHLLISWLQSPSGVILEPPAPK